MAKSKAQPKRGRPPGTVDGPAKRRLTAGLNDYKEFQLCCQNGFHLEKNNETYVPTGKTSTPSEIIAKYPVLEGYDYGSVNSVYQRFKKQHGEHSADARKHGSTATPNRKYVCCQLPILIIIEKNSHTLSLFRWIGSSVQQYDVRYPGTRRR